MTYERILADMQSTYRELTGFDADSATDIGIRLKILARQLERLFQQVEELGRQAFPQTSTGPALDRHAQCRGLARKPARRAEGVLLFSREVPAAQDLSIAAGIVCATRPEPQIQFETIGEAALPAGETQVEVPARAVAAGEEGNVAPGAVCLMITAPSGISRVENPGAFDGGADEEPDDALRDRLLYAFRNISNGTNPAFYYDLAMNRENVLSTAVIPRARGRGTVDVVVHCDTGADETVYALQQELEQAKEINVDVLVRPALPKAVDLSVTLAPTLADGFDAAAEECHRALGDYVGSLGVGEPLILARLTAHLLSLEGIYNLAVSAPAQDVHPDSDEILVAGGITVERMTGG